MQGLSTRPIDTLEQRPITRNPPIATTAAGDSKLLKGRRRVQKLCCDGAARQPDRTHAIGQDLACVDDDAEPTRVADRRALDKEQIVKDQLIANPESGGGVGSRARTDQFERAELNIEGDR